MPEIAEVARACHFLRLHLQNRKIAAVEALEDAKLFATAKTGLTKAKLESALSGRTVKDARQQGKYFWLELDKPPHLLCHFGMTGWFKFSNDDTAYYKPQKERIQEEKRAAAQEANGTEVEEEQDDKQDWPPRFWKLLLKMEGDPHVEAAFIDARRFGKILLVDAPADQMRNTTPLKENGPDPIQDKEIVTAAWLKEKLMRKRIPVKAALLDQAFVSGVGNWVADEVLYQARIHPEQYSNTFSTEQVQRLHDSLANVCQTACDALADSSKFPEHWLMRHRWGKGKQDGDRLPSGEKIKHITVGGRTSAIVPSVQKKTGPLVGGDEGPKWEDDDDDGDAHEPVKPTPTNGKASRQRGRKAGLATGADLAEADMASKPTSTPKRKAAVIDDHVEKQEPPTSRRRSTRQQSRPDAEETSNGKTISTRSQRQRGSK